MNKNHRIDLSLILFFLLGLILRLSFVLTADFPIHDGGLFYAMIKDIEANHFALPLFTSYNFDRIAFAYPPLALYMGAILYQFFNIDLLTIFRFVPLLMNLGTAFFIYRLTRIMKFSKEACAISFLAFMLLPESYRWIIMGGGLTRSTGLLFAVLAITAIYQVYTEPRKQKIFIAGFASALVVLTHLEMAWFTFYSAILLFLFFGRSRISAFHSIIIAAITLLFTSPWWIAINHRFGLSIFISAVSGGTEQWSNYHGLIDMFISPTREAFFPVLLGLALLGIVIKISRGEYFLPVWVVTIFLLQGRGSEAKAVIPFALLIGIAVTEGIIKMVQSNSTNKRWKSKFYIYYLGSISICYVLIAAMIGNRSLLSPLSVPERQAMNWISENTSPEDNFLIISGDWWGEDRVSEWFPVLSQRQSLLTVQGYEFSLSKTFPERIRGSNQIQQCVLLSDLSCIENWARAENKKFSYLYVSKRGINSSLYGHLSEDCCAMIRKAGLDNPRFQLVFENTDLVILRNTLNNSSGPIGKR
jgi:hypothetical protein